MCAADALAKIRAGARRCAALHGSHLPRTGTRGRDRFCDTNFLETPFLIA